MSDTPAWQDVLDYWFADSLHEPRALADRVQVWFRSNAEADRDIKQRFGALIERALAGELAEWADDIRGRLALVLLLDQFTRNVYRGSARAFAGDARALELSREAIAAGLDMTIEPVERAFLYMPLEHAEDLGVQTLSVDRATANLDGVPPGALRHQLEQFLKAAREHAETVRRFGRYPHRNKVMGRASSVEESAWLSEGGRGWGQ